MGKSIDIELNNKNEKDKKTKKNITNGEEQKKLTEQNNEVRIGSNKFIKRNKDRNMHLNEHTGLNKLKNESHIYKVDKIKKEAGITIITLAITILIIIILASITINAVLGDNGLLEQAQDAKDLAESTTLETGEKMNKVLQEYMNVMAEDGGGITEPEEDTTPPTVTIIEGEITESSIEINVTANDPESGLASENAYIYYLNGTEKTRSDSSSYTFSGLTASTPYTIKVEVYNGVGIKGEDSITISTSNPPTVENSKGEEFTTTTQIQDASGDAVWIPGGFEIEDDSANDADDGIVIQDSKENQFVWIPVKDDNLFKRYDGYWQDSKQSYVSSGQHTEPFANGYSSETSEYNAMVSSVKEHDGFYVGRYEAGTTNSNRNSSSGISDTVVVKKNAYVYNYVKWGNSMSDANGGAVELSKKFASANEYATVTSTLIYGIQWDAIMNFIDPAYSTGSCSSTSFVRDSSGKGWYDHSEPTKTGYYAVKNIYDLGGNVWEWTMEASSTRYRAFRGGGFSSSGSICPASNRYYFTSNPDYSEKGLGFRVALCIN